MPTYCGGSSAGSITIKSNGGSTFSLNGAQFLPPTTYNLLKEGTYSIVEKTPDGCLVTHLAIVDLITYPILNNVEVEIVPCEPAAAAEATTFPTPSIVSFNWDNTGWTTVASIQGLVGGQHQLLAKDANGCTDTLAFTVAFDDLPELDSATVKNIDCINTIGQISLDVDGGKPPYTFSFNNGLGTVSNPTDIPDPGTYTVTITDANGCTTVAEGIEVEESIKSFATKTLIDICDYEQYTLGDGTIISQPGQYAVRLTAINGCDSLSTTTLGIDSTRLYAPNVFMPNDDGSNDFFTLFTDPNCIQEIVFLRVYDRWGGLVFERKSFPPNDEPLGWDGGWRERACPAGVYAFEASLALYNGQTGYVKGDVTLIR